MLWIVGERKFSQSCHNVRLWCPVPEVETLHILEIVELINSAETFAPSTHISRAPSPCRMLYI